MSYPYHLALAETDVSSRNFCNLIDAAVMLYEEEHRNKGKSKCHTKTTPSEEEESDKMSFLHNFRRKRRSSVASSRRNPEQNHENLNGASTSSSLVELNTISVDSNPRNPLQWLPSSSSSSSLLNQQNPPSSSTLLVEDNTPELYKKEMTIIPPNPNSQSCKTSNTKRKRRAVQETSTTTVINSKKPKLTPYLWKGKEAPEWLVQLIKDMEEHEGRASELIRSCLGPSVSEARGSSLRRL
ncbi:unnamed protein product [Microthlaspi erraticum]|uniref:Uncharacterized protein n=1 Tax=Microthlaspi erraticum TaxID=1685480 RepID=A0A6D2IM10_9BRAS|nr:unnamed protein product [Microthlaspi erraticum]